MTMIHVYEHIQGSRERNSDPLNLSNFSHILLRHTSYMIRTPRAHKLDLYSVRFDIRIRNTVQKILCKQTKMFSWDLLVANEQSKQNLFFLQWDYNRDLRYREIKHNQTKGEGSGRWDIRSDCKQSTSILIRATKVHQPCSVLKCHYQPCTSTVHSTYLNMYVTKINDMYMQTRNDVAKHHQ